MTTPTQEEKDSFTRVLLGNLDIERLIWPKKNRIDGGDMDILARRRVLSLILVMGSTKRLRSWYRSWSWIFFECS